MLVYQTALHAQEIQYAQNVSQVIICIHLFVIRIAHHRFHSVFIFPNRKIKFYIYNKLI